MNKLLILTLVLLTVISCKQASVQEGETDGRVVFKYNESAGITSLDPAFARSFENIAVVNQLFNGLLQMNDKLEIQPAIAKNWDISKDGLIYTFHLRNNVFFHDHHVFEGGIGRKVTAFDFVHSFFRIIDSKVASPGAWIFNEVDFSETSDYKGFIAENDSTLSIYLKRPFPPFLGILTMQYCSVVPYEIVGHYGDDFRNNPVGTGPFMFKAWKEAVKLVLVKNPTYFEMDGPNRLPYLDAISVSFIKERQTEFMGFINGDFDLLSGIDGLHKNELITPSGELESKYSEKFIMKNEPFLKTDYMGFYIDSNSPLVKDHPLNKKEVRQAINYGINRSEMVKYLRNGIGTPANAGIIPAGMPSYNPEEVKGYSFDQEKARDLLAKAGYPEGKNLPEIVLSTTSIYQDMAEFVQNQLATLGIKIKIDILPTAIHTEQVARSSLNFFRKSWVADYPDGENFLTLFYSKNFSPLGPNYTHFKNSDFDRLYELAKSETDDQKRFKLYREMENLVIEEAPVLLLFYDRAVRFYPKTISGLEVNPMNLLTLKRVKKTH
ncbi:MAG: ABC transporter substrate-binding protein [Bacteroidetes bacterium]|nr:ABC transporter substrate-binding protein [Bacteroidota bacterium]HET6243404.1 ABC transporter substrate-binding protein [Bacteroidia bacterium]